MAPSDTFQPGAPVVFSSPTRKGPPKLRWGDVMFEVPPGASLQTLWEARRTGTIRPDQIDHLRLAARLQATSWRPGDGL